MFSKLLDKQVQKTRKEGLMFTIPAVLLLDGPNWLENLKNWIREVFQQMIDLGSIILLGVATVVFFVITIGAVARGFNSHRQGASWLQVAQESLGVFAILIILGITASFAAVMAANQGIFSPGVSSWIQTIFGGR